MIRRPPIFTLLFFFSCYGDHRNLHSFPTRRSSDPDRPATTRRITGPREARPGVHEVARDRSEEHTSELQSRENLVCRLLLEKKKKKQSTTKKVSQTKKTPH